MRAREKAICEVANVSDIGEVSDGFHTFNGLYEQRMILFAALVKAYKDKAWKSYRHEDGEYCFGGGWFIVGIDTPEGSYTYHYENKYWDMFDCVDLLRAKHWDGHTEADAEVRLMSLKPANCSEFPNNSDTISRKWLMECVDEGWIKFDTEKDKNIYVHLVRDIAPSTQPEIIRCKDCKHWIPYDWMFSDVWQSKNIADYPEDEIGCDCCDVAMKANDFCSRGERRTE